MLRSCIHRRISQSKSLFSSKWKRMPRRYTAKMPSTASNRPRSDLTPLYTYIFTYIIQYIAFLIYSSYTTVCTYVHTYIHIYIHTYILKARVLFIYIYFYPEIHLVYDCSHTINPSNSNRTSTPMGILSIKYTSINIHIHIHIRIHIQFKKIYTRHSTSHTYYCIALYTCNHIHTSTPTDMPYIHTS